jgi:hypothetical protein
MLLKITLLIFKLSSDLGIGAGTSEHPRCSVCSCLQIWEEWVLWRIIDQHVTYQNIVSTVWRLLWERFNRSCKKKNMKWWLAISVVLVQRKQVWADLWSLGVLFTFDDTDSVFADSKFVFILIKKLFVQDFSSHENRGSKISLCSGHTRAPKTLFALRCADPWWSISNLRSIMPNRGWFSPHTQMDGCRFLFVQTQTARSTISEISSIPEKMPPQPLRGRDPSPYDLWFALRFRPPPPGRGPPGAGSTSTSLSHKTLLSRNHGTQALVQIWMKTIWVIMLLKVLIPFESTAHCGWK